MNSPRGDRLLHRRQGARAYARARLQRPDGNPTTLEAFKGKTLLVNIWATWCVPCRSEMPALDRLQKAAGSDKFEVLAINVDTTRLERPKAFLEEIGVRNLKFYADPRAIFSSICGRAAS